MTDRPTIQLTNRRTRRYLTFLEVDEEGTFENAGLSEGRTLNEDGSPKSWTFEEDATSSVLATDKSGVCCCNCDPGVESKT